MCFTIFYNETAIKTRSSKNPKTEIFPKGLNHGFGQNIGIFPSFFFFFGNIGKKNVFSDILKRKNTFLAHKRKKFKKSKKWDFSKEVSQRFWSKHCHFSTLFLLGNIGQENVFYDILQRKNAFLGYKNTKFIQVEKLTFFQRS